MNFLNFVLTQSHQHFSFAFKLRIGKRKNNDIIKNLKITNKNKMTWWRAKQHTNGITYVTEIVVDGFHFVFKLKI